MGATGNELEVSAILARSNIEVLAVDKDRLKKRRKEGLWYWYSGVFIRATENRSGPFILGQGRGHWPENV